MTEVPLHLVISKQIQPSTAVAVWCCGDASLFQSKSICHNLGTNYFCSLPENPEGKHFFLPRILWFEYLYHWCPGSLSFSCAVWLVKLTIIQWNSQNKLIKHCQYYTCRRGIIHPKDYVGQTYIAECGICSKRHPQHTNQGDFNVQSSKRSRHRISLGVWMYST